jgi:hypothetical protein
MIASLRPQDDHAAGDEGDGHGDRIEEVCFDPAAEDQSEESERKEGDGDVRREASRGRVAREPADHRDQAGSVLPAHGENRACLNHDGEYLRALVGESEQLLSDDEMPGARDRQKLRQPLDDAEKHGLDEVEIQMRATTLAGRIFNSWAMSVHGHTGT